MSDRSPCGLLVVDKPSGPTSHEVVDALRRITRERRIGHTGTLDPLASGVLVACIGPATRLAEYLTAAVKEYDAEVTLGVATDTWDAAGKVVAEAPMTVDAAAVERALEPLRGPILQRPPAFSARRAAGRRAYERARAGEVVELEPRAVVIERLRLDRFEPPRLWLSVRCSAGTYVRALARELGTRLGGHAHLSALRRTRSGAFGIEQAVPLARLGREVDWREALLPPETALVDWPVVRLDADEAARLVAGAALPRAVGFDGLARAHAPDGRLIAVVDWDARRGRVRPRKVLAADAL